MENGASRGGKLTAGEGRFSYLFTRPAFLRVLIALYTCDIAGLRIKTSNTRIRHFDPINLSDKIIRGFDPEIFTCPMRISNTQIVTEIDSLIAYLGSESATSPNYLDLEQIRQEWRSISQMWPLENIQSKRAEVQEELCKTTKLVRRAWVFLYDASRVPPELEWDREVEQGENFARFFATLPTLPAKILCELEQHSDGGVEWHLQKYAEWQRLSECEKNCRLNSERSYKQARKLLRVLRAASEE